MLLNSYFQGNPGSDYNAYTDALQVAASLKEQNDCLTAENKKLQEDI